MISCYRQALGSHWALVNAYETRLKLECAVIYGIFLGYLAVNFFYVRHVITKRVWQPWKRLIEMYLILYCT